MSASEYNDSVTVLPDHPLARLASTWCFATTPQLPPSDQYCETRDRMDRRVGVFREDLLKSGCEKNATLLLHSVLSEIGGNSFDHNLGQWRDIPGVFFANEIMQDRATIVLADRGQGIRTTLQRIRPDIADDLGALRIAFLERISGRAPEKRGNGLKFVRETVLSDGIDLYFQSGTARYAIIGKSEEWATSEQSVYGCLAILTMHR